MSKKAENFCKFNIFLRLTQCTMYYQQKLTSTYHWDLILSSSATFCFLASLTAARRDFIVFTVLSITSWLSGLADFTKSENSKSLRNSEFPWWMSASNFYSWKINGHVVSSFYCSIGRHNISRNIIDQLWPFALNSCYNSLIRADKPCSQRNLLICLLY